MMKRISAAVVLAAVCVIGLASVADAAGYRFKSAGMVQWRRTDLYATLAALDPAAKLDQNSALTSTAGHLDSTYIYVGNSALSKDTSAVFTLPGDFCVPAAVDSTPSVILVFHRTAAAASGDTLYASCQPYLGGTDFITHAAAPIAAAKAITGAVTAGVWAVFPAGSGLGYAGSETMTSLLPRNVEFVPGFGVTREFRLILWSDQSAATAGGGLQSVEVLYASAAGN